MENILGKGENAGYQHFLLIPKCFQKPPFSGLLKVGIVWQRAEKIVKDFVRGLNSKSSENISSDQNL